MLFILKFSIIILLSYYQPKVVAIAIEPHKQSNQVPDQDIITITTPVTRGALIDSYESNALIIKFKSPSDVIKDVIGKIDLKIMDKSTSDQLLTNLGNIELHYQKQFKDLLSTYQELIITPYPYEEKSNGQLLDITTLRRPKRSWWRAIIAFARAVRPVARNAGKLTRYGKFMKGLKYTGYVASAGVFAYEMADIFGAIPDVKYEEVTRQLRELHEGRVKDLSIMKNITLMTVNNNNLIKDLSSEINTAISESHDRFEITIRVSQIFGSYIQQLMMGLSLIFQGKLSSSIVSLELQRAWLENKLPHPLLNDISSITPHLKIKIKALDEQNDQLILTVDVPRVDSKFQILNYVEWEPKVIHDGTCYTSPKPIYLLAYPPTSSSSLVPKPLLIDPDSCMTEGFIMCEADSILQSIPNLSVNSICTSEINLKRYKRNADDLYLKASDPTYDISAIVDRSLKSTTIAETGIDNLKRLQTEIEEALKEAKKGLANSEVSLKEAENTSIMIKILFVFVIPSVCYLLYLILSLIVRMLKERKERRYNDRRNKILEGLRRLENK